jgi:ribosomal protein S18 acetylase RimI-like enzyme
MNTWFQNPKDLNLVDPSMKYPFNFNKWLDKYNLKDNNRTFVLKENDWIIGYMSLNLRPRNSSIHLFHVFIDREHRGKGLGKMLIEYTVQYAKKTNAQTISLFVLPKNYPAVNLYKSFGFKNSGEFSPTGSPKWILEI